MYDPSRDQQVVMDSSPQNRTSKQVIDDVSEHAIQLEETQFAALYQRQHLLVLSYIRRQLPVAEDAEDMLVEVFLAALGNEELLEWAEERQLAWLRRVAHNKIVDHQRLLMRRPMVPLDAVNGLLYEQDYLAPDQISLRNEEMEELRMHMARLPQLQQEILRMRFAENLSSETIAQRVRKSSGAVRKILARSLNLLRTIYTQPGGDEA